MKIANIVCVYPPYKGGIGTAAYDFRNMVSGSDFEVTTFTPDYGHDVDIEEDKKNKIVRIKPLFKFGNGAFLPQLFKKLKEFDVVYLHYPFFGGAEIVYLFKLLNPSKKLVIRYHMDVVGLSPLAKILSIPSSVISNKLFNKADLIITASLDYIKNGVLGKVYKKTADKFREVPYAVNIDRFKPLEKNNNILKLLFVGGLDQAHYFKGVSNLIEALSSLDKETTNNWSLDIVGSGSLEDEYKNKAKDLGIDGKINFLGKVSDEDLPSIYARSHVTVLPSINKGEAFGIVLIESMASGTAVLASDLAGVRSVFRDKMDGLLVKTGDVNDLKDKIKYLINNKDELSKMSKSAELFAKERYSFMKVSEDLKNIFNNL